MSKIPQLLKESRNANIATAGTRFLELGKHNEPLKNFKIIGLKIGIVLGKNFLNVRVRAA